MAYVLSPAKGFLWASCLCARRCSAPWGGALRVARYPKVAAAGCAYPLAPRRFVCRAAQEEESKGADVKQAEQSVTSSNGAPEEQPPQAGEEKGQLTAIITGAASIILGVLYLVLVQFLDSRGANMLPPPPEAFLQ